MSNEPSRLKGLRTIHVNLLRKLFDNNEREVTRLRTTVEKINALESEYEAIPTERLADKTAEFKALIEERRQKVRDRYLQSSGVLSLDA